MNLEAFNRFAKVFQDGQIIFSEFELGDTFYLIQSGQIKLVKLIGGTEKVLDILQSSDLFGEMAILDNSLRSATAIAIGTVTVLEFNRQNFEILMQGNPQVALTLLKTFSKRIHDQKKRLMILTLKDPTTKIAAVFLMLNELQPPADPHSPYREFIATIDDIAHWTGMSSAQTKDTLMYFIRQHHIEVYAESIIVKNINMFDRLVTMNRKYTTARFLNSADFNSADFSKSDLVGRKIFLLYPSPLIYEIAYDLIQEEFEVYLIKDHQMVHKAIEHFPDSIIFVNINAQLSEKEWQMWSLELMLHKPDKQLGIGILTSTNDENLQAVYLSGIKVNCGFLRVQTDFKKTTAQMQSILAHANAKGRRKYIRLVVKDESIATINIPCPDGTFIRGSIQDISAAGVACIFEKDPHLEQNMVVSNMQLKLHTMLIKTEGTVFGVRIDNNVKTYVMMFSHHSDTSVSYKIRKYIHNLLQNRMNTLLK
jgi:CRP-like cAMP-binding protein